MRHNEEMSVREALSASRKHVRKALIVSSLVMLGVVAYIIFVPRSYESQSKLLVRLGRENLAVDPAAGMSEKSVLLNPSSREEELNSVVELLASRTVAEKVVEQLGAETILHPKEFNPAGSGEAKEGFFSSTRRAIGSGIGQMVGGLQAVGIVAELTDDQKAVEYLGKKLAVEPVRNSNVVSAVYESSNPAHARKVLETVVQVALDLHTEVHLTPQSFTFLEGQTERLRSELDDSQQKLRDLKNESNWIEPMEQRKAFVTQVAGIETDQLATNAQLAALEAEVAALEASKESIADMEVAEETAGIPSLGADQMRERLYELQLQEKELLSKYKEDYFQVRQIREQIAQAKRVMEAEEISRTQVVRVKSPVLSQLEKLLSTKQAQVAALEAKSNQLTSQLDEAYAKIADFNEDALGIQKLEREIALQDGNYQRYSVNLQQARIDEARHASQISNLRVAQPATLEPKPANPRLGTSLAIGMVLAIASGLATIVGAVILDEPKVLEESGAEQPVAAVETERKPQRPTYDKHVVASEEDRELVLPSGETEHGAWEDETSRRVPR